MQISCTKDLLDYIGIKSIPADPSANLVLSWSANLINIGRQKAIVAANDSSRCGFILYGIKNDDIKKLDTLMTDGIRSCLEAECISPELIEQYIADCGAISFTETANHMIVERLNKLCERALYYSDEYKGNELLQRHILRSLNDDFVVGRSKPVKGYFRAYQKLASDLFARYGVAPYRCCAAELEVELEQESVCRRRILVPLCYNFRQFHRVLQDLFAWKSFNRHDFIIEQYSNGRMKYTLVGTPREVENEGESTRPDEEVLLSDIFPAYDHIIYNYDFGGNRIHKIRLISVINDYENNVAVCTSCEGTASHENAGSPGGYVEMLHVLDDPNDPDYERTEIWSGGIRCKKYNVDEINVNLKLWSR